MHHMLQNIEICSDHENCEARRAQINMTKGFVAKEPMKWHTASSFFQKKIERLFHIYVDRSGNRFASLYSVVLEPC